MPFISTDSRIDIDAINALSDDVKGWAHAYNLIFTTLAPQGTFGWSLSIDEFAYDTHSGRQSVWDEASVFTADLLDSFELYKAVAANKAHFVAFNKSNATTALTSEQWHHALEYVKQVTDYVNAPAMLANMPTEQTANYFMGNTQTDQQIRKAAYSNEFALMFDQDSQSITSKIELYQTAKVPLYCVGEELEKGSLTRIGFLEGSMSNFVVVGGGAEGLEMVSPLVSSFAGKSDHTVTLVEPSSHHLWKPRLHEIAAGTFDNELDSVAFRLHAACHGYQYVQARMSGLQRANKTIAVIADFSPEQTLKYDYLLIALAR